MVTETSAAPAVSRVTSVLVVDDEPPIIDLLGGYVEREGWRLLTATDGETALAVARESAPDVVVLDLMLPAVDGLEVCRRLRSFSDAYVLMLTARTDEVDRIVGLSIGADDYLAKPFSPREVIARIKAMLRRPRSQGRPAAVSGGGLEIDTGARRVTVDGRPVTLSLTEFELLATLARDPGVVVSRQRLLDRVWGTDFVGDDHLIDVHIANLRAKLTDDPTHPRFVETVRGVGFRFIAGE
jgi:DNA-binding response OmpR family regulator